MQAVFRRRGASRAARDDGRGGRRRPRAWPRPGDAVVLSPACSSFDMFRDYAHRAEVFRTAVQVLISSTSDKIPLDPELD